MKKIITILSLILFYSCGNNKNERIVSYYDNGNIEWLVKYNSVKDTTNKTVIGYYSDGNIKCSSDKTNELIRGEQSTYFQTGKLEKRWSISNGLLTGEYIEYLPSEKLSIKGEYKIGQKTGVWEYYNSVGEKFVRKYIRDTLQGNSQEHKKDGSIVYGKYLNGHEVGTWITKSKDSIIIMETNYINGALSGQVKEYYKSGELYVDGFFDNGKKNGEWSVYSIQGKLDTIEIYRNDSLIELVEK